MSNLVKHAERELERIYGPLDELESGDMNKQMVDHLLEMIRTFSEGGHSGGSAAYALGVLDRLLQFKPLSPLTNDPDEWMHIAEATAGRPDVWQNVRSGSCFSHDGGLTHHDIDSPKLSFLGRLRYRNERGYMIHTTPNVMLGPEGVAD